MTTVPTSQLQGAALDWAVAKCDGLLPKIAATASYPDNKHYRIYTKNHYDAYGNACPTTYSPSTDWAQGGPIIERENITIIRADNTYKVDSSGYATLERVPQWFAETSQWVGHSTCTSYEGEYFDPAFMIDEDGGHYGTTPLLAAMRCYVASRIGQTVEVPDEMLK